MGIYRMEENTCIELGIGTIVVIVLINIIVLGIAGYIGYKFAAKADIDENLGRKPEDKKTTTWRYVVIISVCVLIGFFLVNIIIPSVLNIKKIGESSVLYNIL